VSFIQVVRGITAIIRILRKNKIHKQVEKEVPRYLWNKSSTVPTSLFSSLTSRLQGITVAKQQAEK
jgi:hypothetical protein